MRLSDLLQRDNNNLDIFRLIAAALVIYGHAYAIAPQEGHSDVLVHLLGYDYSGSLAVKLFFFLSGLVVTNSLLHKRDVAQFVMARFFRIWPALLVVTALCALVLGPLVTALPLADYRENRGQTTVSAEPLPQQLDLVAVAQVTAQFGARGAWLL